MSEDPEPSPDRGRGLLGAVAAVALAVPALAAFGSALRRPWLPVSDWALIELHVREVGTGSTPLVGAYSRYGWHHPGPWPFYLLAGPYRLVGAGHGLLAGAALWSLVALAALGFVVWRSGGGLALVALPVLALLVHSLGAGFLSDPWNPSLPVLVIALLVAVAHRHALGARWSAPVLAAVGSLVVQSHISLLPIAVAVAGVAIVVRHVGRPGEAAADPERARWPPGRVALATGAVLVVAWAPPVIEQLSHHPGNLTLIARYVRAPGRDLTPSDRAPVGVGRAGALIERQLGLPAPWLGARERARYLDLDSVAGRGRLVDIVPLLAAVAGALVVAVRRRDRAALALLAVAGAGAIGAFASLATLKGPAYGWLVRGIWPIAAWLWIACVWALGRAAAALATGSTANARPAWPRVERAVAPVAVLLVVAISGATTWHTTLGGRQDDARARATARLAPAAVAAARRAGGAFLYPLPVGGQETWGLVLALDRAGVRWTDDLDRTRGLRLTIAVAVGAPAIAEARRSGHRVLAEATEDGPGAAADRVIAAVAGPLDVTLMRTQLGQPKPPIR